MLLNANAIAPAIPNITELADGPRETISFTRQSAGCIRRGIRQPKWKSRIIRAIRSRPHPAARKDLGFLGSIEEKIVPHDQDPEESQPQPHQHSCGNLFGCGDEKGTGVLREDIKDSAFTNRAADHLLHLDEINQAQFDDYLNARG